MVAERDKSIFKMVDWFTIALYVGLLVFGWFSVCGASYDYGEVDFFSFDSRAGKQLLWIGCSFGLGFLLLMLEERIYEMFTNIIYVVMMALLVVTIVIAPDTKGSHSWLILGPVSLQPAEFAKFATALCVARFMNSYGFNIHKMKDFFFAVGIVVLPMLLIVAQRETGSALVYTSFFLMFYREGMPGSILFSGISAVCYFVIGLRFQDVLFAHDSTSVGKFAVMLMVTIFSIGMVKVYCNNNKVVRNLSILSFGATGLALLFAYQSIPFDVTYVQLGVILFIVAYLVYLAIRDRIMNYAFIATFAVCSLGFHYSTDYVMNKVMEPHQRIRINVLLGIEEDLSGAGYNVNQSKIAIGSGGLTGKGFLNGTQTKLKYVPEQDTDFIFCTVGEEEGFVGAAGVLVGFLVLILRLFHLAERQPTRFGRIYGYSVLGIFFFHLFINVGMVLGLTPVIGIPLPFFSYGGSSLWGFTILLFIFLRIDAERERMKR
ncbi:MAG: rod shape-determining protein RodA [Bacteroidales bacterium]|nr:rod shape-determining protein RodA [Candidatus Minthousia equi]